MELAQSSLGEQFLWFSKNYLSWFNHICLLFDKRKSCVFQIFFILRSIKAYLCTNIINFDSVDFSERRPEEVISFFWRLVYIVLYVDELFSLCIFWLFCLFNLPVEDEFLYSFNLDNKWSWILNIFRQTSSLLSIPTPKDCLCPKGWEHMQIACCE